MTYVYLITAIILEVIGTSALQASEQFTKPKPLILTFAPLGDRAQLERMLITATLDAAVRLDIVDLATIGPDVRLRARVVREIRR